MANPFFIAAIYFEYLLLILSVLYAIGNLILGFLKYKPAGFYASLFDRGLTGLTVSVFLYSIIASSGITVQWGILFVAFFVAYELRKTRAKRLIEPIGPKVSVKKGNWSKFVPVIILTLIVFSWFAYHNLNFSSSFPYAIPHKDEIYYTNISSSLMQLGYENRQGAYLPSGIEQVTEPYHYFDLWFTALLSAFTGAPTILSVSLLCLPVFSLLTIFGILAVFETNGPVKIWHYAIVPLLLFTRGVYLVRYNPDILWAENFSESILEFKSEKLGVLYVFAVLVFRFILSGNLIAALATILVLPVVSIGNMPGIMGGALLFIMVAVVARIINVKEFFRSFLYIFIIGVFIWLFYRFSGEQSGNAYLKNGLLIFTDLNEFSFQSVKVTGIELVVRILHNPWRTLVIHLPFLLLALIAIKENRQYARAAILMFCVYTASLLAFGFFYKLLDAPQFYTNNLPVLNVFLVIGLALFVNSVTLNLFIRKVVFTGITCLLFAILVFSLFAYQDSMMFTELYSQKYLDEISSVHNRLTKQESVAVLYNPGQQPDLYNCDKSGPNVMYLPFFKKFKPPVDINVFAMNGFSHDKEIAAVQKRFIKAAPFYQYVIGQAADGKFRDITSSQMDYLKEKNIQYLFVSPGTDLSHELVSRVKRRIKDERSGEQLLMLNPFP